MRVSTGAMFSMTLCFASTSHAPTSTAPAAPHGSSHVSHSRWACSSRPMAENMPRVKAPSTPPPSAIST